MPTTPSPSPSPPARSGKASGGSPRLYMDTPVMYLKGVGPVRAAALRKLGIVTAGDLLFHVPHRYEDASTISPIAQLQPGMQATVVGRVVSKGIIPTRKGLRVFQAVLQDASGLIEVSWPGQPFLDRSIDKGDVLLVSGSVRFFHGRQLQPREYVNLGAEEEGPAKGRVLAVYPATEGLSFKIIRSIVDAHLEPLLAQVTEYLPRDVVAAAGVPDIGAALRMVHRPATIAQAMEGRARLAFEELFFVQLLHQRAKDLARTARPGQPMVNKRERTSALRQRLPYTLTGAQVRALREIFEDMCSPRRMHRLLQGDVGSGKTIVALFASLLAIENGCQAALMVPTELLAEQHARSIGELLQPLGIEPLLLTGSLKARERRAILERVAAGEPTLVIGTHALIQDAVSFGNLGLVVIDEQHRFGVEQRKALSEKAPAADVLLMSATPIPRSLALTLYGDLDVTVLDERPPGRRPIATGLRREAQRDRVFTFLNRQLDAGRQAYIVYPIIQESEKSDLKAAVASFEALTAEGGALAGRATALIHGKLPADERDAIMRRFRDGEIQVLVATTVIEVGIDVPNATVMIVEQPERFGLSQLHQLRGRVGRGSAESYCILLGDVGQDSGERLAVFCETEDGFEIARADLRMRGMGDLFGERQSGVPVFRVADPLRDEALLVSASAAAASLLERDPGLEKPAHAGLRRVLGERYSRSLELFRVG